MKVYFEIWHDNNEIKDINYEINELLYVNNKSLEKCCKPTD